MTMSDDASNVVGRSTPGSAKDGASLWPHDEGVTGNSGRLYGRLIQSCRSIIAPFTCFPRTCSQRTYRIDSNTTIGEYPPCPQCNCPVEYNGTGLFDSDDHPAYACTNTDW